MHLTKSFVASLALLASFSLPALAQDQQEKVDMAAMMERAKKFTQPGKNHELLKTFLGTWDTELRMNMGGKETPPEKGSMTCRWLMDDRWLQCESTGRMMGRPMRTAFIMGYDNFRQSFVSAAINDADTAMIHSEGDLDPSGKALIMYGTLDEYLTGEIGKMVKSIFRFVSPDEMRFEVHDLPIGETNTKVFEIRYVRHAESAGKTP